jgi:hypothetical protein
LASENLSAASLLLRDGDLPVTARAELRRLPEIPSLGETDRQCAGGVASVRNAGMGQLPQKRSEKISDFIRGLRQGRGCAGKHPIHYFETQSAVTLELRFAEP